MSSDEVADLEWQYNVKALLQEIADNTRPAPPASDPAKVECPNCGEFGEHLTMYRTMDDVLVKDYNCHHRKVATEIAKKVAAHEENMKVEYPEPAAPEPSMVERIAADLAAGTFRGVRDPAAPVEMPEAVRKAAYHLRFDANGHESDGCRESAEINRSVADALESFWRDHSRTVGITEELENILRWQSQRATNLRTSPLAEAPGAANDIDATVAAVRAQAAGVKVELVKVREVLMHLLSKLASDDTTLSLGRDAAMLRDALTELNKFEGVH